jgi:DNA-binding transcriptional MocR family regulator
VKFLYTVPSFHNPAGVTLTAARRAQVLGICQRAGLLVVEDNPYGLLGFDRGPQRALQADDAAGVVYLGSFSKTIAPGLRVGWAVAPAGVRDKLVLAAEAAVLCNSSMAQLLIGEYLASQPWREQIKVFCELYRERRDAMLGALSAMMPEGCRWTRPGGGFYVWLRLPPGLSSKSMLPRAIASRVAYVPGTGFYADGGGAESLRLSYCFPEPDQIREGIRRLAEVVDAEAEIRATFGPSRPGARGGAGPADLTGPAELGGPADLGSRASAGGPASPGGPADPGSRASAGGPASPGGPADQGGAAELGGPASTGGRADGPAPR